MSTSLQTVKSPPTHRERAETASSQLVKKTNDVTSETLAVYDPDKEDVYVGRLERAWAYVQIARPDHWFKNVFMLPGVCLALVLTPLPLTLGGVLVPFLLGVMSVCLIASANYVINEFLDAKFDRYHPKKKSRPCASGLVRGRYVFLEYGVLSIVGLGMAYFVGPRFALLGFVLLFAGVCYNVSPVRTKDRPYLDVLTESINNPLRFLLGWTIVLPTGLPPSSVLLTYWMGGAFLMGVKRYAEYRAIGDAHVAGSYRRSFKFYTEQTLLLSSFFYALLSAFFLGVFLIKYRVEFLLTFPFFGILFTWYLAIGMRADSSAQTPEKLFREYRFMLFTGLLALFVLALFYIDIPGLYFLLEHNIYAVP